MSAPESDQPRLEELEDQIRKLRTQLDQTARPGALRWLVPTILACWLIFLTIQLFAPTTPVPRHLHVDSLTVGNRDKVHLEIMPFYLQFMNKRIGSTGINALDPEKATLSVDTVSARKVHVREVKAQLLHGRVIQ